MGAKRTKRFDEKRLLKMDMRKKIEKYTSATLGKIADPGVLLVVSKKDGSRNVMTIGWGLIGIFWAKPVFMVAVKHSRFSHGFLEDNGEFTVNVPSEEMGEAVALCGRFSGRTHDKFKECKFSTAKGKKVSVPIIRQCKLHYECRVLHKLQIIPDLIPADVRRTYYSGRDENNFHTLYYGEILSIY
jgi:flavin reductase (DIM6/NTAB) family NADH-FMN oxidoreductase RutF